MIGFLFYTISAAVTKISDGEGAYVHELFRKLAPLCQNTVRLVIFKRCYGIKVHSNFSKIPSDEIVD